MLEAPEDPSHDAAALHPRHVRSHHTIQGASAGGFVAYEIISMLCLITVAVLFGELDQFRHAVELLHSMLLTTSVTYRTSPSTSQAQQTKIIQHYEDPCYLHICHQHPPHPFNKYSARRRRPGIKQHMLRCYLRLRSIIHGQQSFPLPLPCRTSPCRASSLCSSTIS